MKDDLIPEFLRVLLLSALQLGVFVVLHDAVVETYVRYESPTKNIGVSFGNSLQYGSYVLSMLACVNAVAQVFARRIGIRFVVAAAATVVWALYWLNLTDVVPHRVAMLSTVGMISFATGVLFMLPKIKVRVELR